MSILIAMRGLPASGKTTKARVIAQLLTNGVVVGRDFERQSLYNEWFGGGIDEDVVTVAIEAKVRALLKADVSVVVDNTHIRPRDLKRWAKIASECGADFTVHDVPTPLETCLFRDMQRQANGERFVGENVIRRMAKQIKWTEVRPTPPIVVNPITWEEQRNDNWDLLSAAIIVDIDGTLAHMVEVNGTVRSPYDYSRVHEDAADPTIVRMVRDYADMDGRIIVCSGRDDDCRDVTEQWLKDHDIPFDLLLMRPKDAKDANGNKLPDWIVKLNLYNEHIRGHYAVEYVLDDRQQVVDMWRALGLKCLQVQPGDF